MKLEQVRLLLVGLFAVLFCSVPVSAVVGPEGGSGPEEEPELGAKHWPAVSVPHTRVVLSSKLNEYVTELPVEEGQQVAEGDVVLRFDARQIEAQIAVAEVEADYESRIDQQKDRYEHMKREYERSKALAEGEAVISESKLDQHRTQMQMARLDLEEMKRQAIRAEKQLALYQARATDYTLKAPGNGVVSQVWIEEGEMATEGEKLIEIIDPEAIEVRVHMPEKLADAIKREQKATLQFACVGGETVPASVYFVSPYVDSSSGTFLVKLLARVGNRELKPGMGCEVRFTPRKKARAETAAASN
jgi:RND family efflux transporter MFP subunit